MSNALLNWSMSKYFVLSILIVIADQVSKHWASANLVQNTINILPILDFRLAHNYGAAFSFLSNAGGWQRWFFIGLSLMVSIVLFMWILRLKKQEKFLAFALACVLGGGIGNLIDRASLGYVVDFISVHYKHWYFPTFNIADMAISLGAFLLIIDMLFFQQPVESKKPAKNSAE